MGILRVLNHQGDGTVTWEVDNPVQIKAAEIVFEKMRSLGAAVYDEDKEEMIDKFRPEAEKLLVIPPVAGG